MADRQNVSASIVSGMTALPVLEADEHIFDIIALAWVGIIGAPEAVFGVRR